MKKFPSLLMSLGLSAGLALAGCGGESPSQVPDPGPTPDPGPPTMMTGTVTTDQMLTGAVTLTGDVVIPAGVTLTVAAGTAISVAGNFSLSVKGNLAVQGTAAAGVQFAGAQGKQWGGIAVSGTGRANISYAQISNAQQGFATSAGTMYALDHVVIKDSQTGLVLASTGSVTKTVLMGMGINQYMPSISIQDSSPTFSDVQVTNGAGNSGLDSIIVSGNSSPQFDHMEVTGFHCAFHFNSGSNIAITNSYVHDNYYGVMVFGVTPFTFSDSNLINNQTANIGDCSSTTVTASGNFYNGAPAFDGSCSGQKSTNPAPTMISTAGYRP